MNSLFVDTSFYIAIVNPSDVAHAAAVKLAGSHRGPTVTREYVLLEVANFLSRADDKSVFLELLLRLRARLS